MFSAQEAEPSLCPSFTLRYPPQVRFGCGTLAGLGGQAAALGSSAVVVCGRTAMRKQGILGRALKGLAGAGIQAATFEEVEADPSLGTVARGVRRVQELGADVVVGLGGGSALDAAKAIACMSGQPHSVYTYFDGAEVERAGLPFVAVPTTAGTGAEITPNAVLTDERHHTKRSLRSPLMIARTVIVDPELTRSMSPYVTACTGMDALVQALEAFVTRTPNPVSDTLAPRAVALIMEALPRAVGDGEDLQARERMALGSLLSGMAFSNSGLGAVHGLAHPIGAKFGVPHGHVCAMLLAPAMRFNLHVSRERFTQVAQAVGLDSAEGLIQRIDELLPQIGLSADLKGWNVADRDLAGIVADSRSGSMGKNPREASDEDLLGVLRQLT